MIPVTHWADGDDDTAWWVRTTLGGSVEAIGLDRPCDTCGGDEWVPLNHPSAVGIVCRGMETFHPERRCGDCDGTGRHTFDVEVGYDDYELTHRVSVVPGMVLPIVDRMEDDPLHGKPHICWDARHGHMLGMNYRQTPITLPPATSPGMWAIQLRKADR